MADVALSSKDAANPASDDYLIGVDASASNGIRKFILSDNWRFGRLGIGATPTHRLHIAGSDEAESDIYVSHSIQNGSGITDIYRPVWLQGNYTATDLATSIVGWGGANSTLTFGNSGAAATGKGKTLNTNVTVQGAGDANNEYACHFAAMRFDIGPDFDQTATPTGRGWLTDWNVHGPIGVQPDMLNGVTMLYNNYYNGSPADSPSAAVWLVTRKGSGGSLTAEHTAADTYPIDVGLGIVGDSNASATSGIGWTKAIQIGGFGSGWKESGSSYIGTGIDISEFSSFGIHIHDRHASGTGPAIAVAAGAGSVIIGATSLVASTSKLEVIAPTTDISIALFGSTSGAGNHGTIFRNGQGQMQIFTVGTTNTFLTGSAAGDAGIRMTTAGKAFHLGGTTKVITVTQTNTLGFFAATPIAQPVLATGVGATEDDIITVLQNLGLVKQS